MPVPSLPVLVVEDDPDIAMLVTTLLRRLGWGTEVVEGVRDARARLAEARFGLVVLDLRLSDGDGLDVLPAARAAGVPVVVASAHAGEEHVQRALEAGAVAFVRKPFTRRILEDALDAAAGRATQAV